MLWLLGLKVVVKKEPKLRPGPEREPNSFFNSGRNRYYDDDDVPQEKSGPRIIDPAFITRTRFPEAWLWLETLIR
jgi:hypothetical protein